MPDNIFSMILIALVVLFGIANFIGGITRYLGGEQTFIQSVSEVLMAIFVPGSVVAYFLGYLPIPWYFLVIGIVLVLIIAGTIAHYQEAKFKKETERPKGIIETHL